MRKIVLLCAAGMSTSLMVERMKESAATQGYEIDVAAYPVAEASKVTGDADIVLIGPQVRYKLNQLKKSLHCPVEPIDMRAYGQMDGATVLAMAKEVLGD